MYLLYTPIIPPCRSCTCKRTDTIRCQLFLDGLSSALSTHCQCPARPCIKPDSAHVRIVDRISWPRKKSGLHEQRRETPLHEDRAPFSFTRYTSSDVSTSILNLRRQTVTSLANLLLSTCTTLRPSFPCSRLSPCLTAFVLDIPSIFSLVLCLIVNICTERSFLCPL